MSSPRAYRRAIHFVATLALASPSAARGCAWGASRICEPAYSTRDPEAPWTRDGAAPDDAVAPPAQPRCYPSSGAGPLAPPELLA